MAYKQKEFKIICRELEIKRRAIENLASQLSANKSRKLWLEREAKEMTIRAKRLKHSLAQLKDYFAKLNGIAYKNKLNLSQSDLARLEESSQPNQILEEALEIIPQLNDLASNLSSQAYNLQEQCLDLENKRLEMEKMVDKAFSNGFQNFERTKLIKN